MTPEMLTRALTSLFGTRFQADAARVLGVSIKTIERNAGGITKPSRDLEDNVINLLHERRRADKILLRELRSACWKERQIRGRMSEKMRKEIVRGIREMEREKALRAAPVLVGEPEHALDVADREQVPVTA